MEALVPAEIHISLKTAVEVDDIGMAALLSRVL
jgi:hypothetical protein